MTEEQTTDEQVIADLVAECARLKAEVKRLQKAHATCIEELAALLAEVKHLRAIAETRDALVRENARLRALVPQDQKLPAR